MSNFRWSFSQWETYYGCPARWNYQSVMKLPRTPPGPAAARGIHMHDRCEAYIKKEIDDVNFDDGTRFGGKTPAKIADKYVHVLDKFRDHPNGERWTELALSFDEDWYLVGGKSSQSWCKGVLDAVRGEKGVLHIGEWKSGSPKQTHSDQRNIYALFGLRKWLVDEVHVTTYYLEDTAPPERLTVKSTAEDKLKAKWWARVEQMRTDRILAPKPGDQCRWCDYARGKGGPCQFG